MTGPGDDGQGYILRQSTRRRRIHLVENRQRAVMLNMDTHPGALYLVDFGSLMPKEQDHSPERSFARFYGVIEMISHSSTEVVCQPDIQNDP